MSCFSNLLTISVVSTRCTIRDAIDVYVLRLKNISLWNSLLNSLWNSLLNNLVNSLFHSLVDSLLNSLLKWMVD